MLGTTGSIQHKNAFKESNGDWTLLLKDQQGQLHQYTLFISQFETHNEIADHKTFSRQKELAIINPQGSSDSIGGEQAGY